MDRLIMILSQANTEVLKEPRGFIKFIQIIIAITAFATAVSNYSQTGLKVTCAVNGTTETPAKLQKLPFYYPYNLQESTKFQVPICYNSTTTPTPKHDAACYGDFSASAQFFVFVGVTAFLYCLFDLAFYVLADDKYHQVAILPKIDFVTTAIYSALWFVSSCAWADAVLKIKHYTDPNTLFLQNEYNRNNLPECQSNARCQSDVDFPGVYTNMNISIVLGFLCVVLWIGNVWFLYKETQWYKEKNGQQTTDNVVVPPQSPSSAI